MGKGPPGQTTWMGMRLSRNHQKMINWWEIWNILHWTLKWDGFPVLLWYTDDQGQQNVKIYSSMKWYCGASYHVVSWNSCPFLSNGNLRKVVWFNQMQKGNKTFDISLNLISTHLLTPVIQKLATFFFMIQKILDHKSKKN